MFEYEKEVKHLVVLEKFGMSSHDSALSPYAATKNRVTCGPCKHMANKRYTINPQLSQVKRSYRLLS